MVLNPNVINDIKIDKYKQFRVEFFLLLFVVCDILLRIIFFRSHKY